MKVTQSCPTLCNPMNYTVHGILQARILEWVAFPFSRGSSQPRDWTQVSCIAGGFFTRWATRGSLAIWLILLYFCVEIKQCKFDIDLRIWRCFGYLLLSFGCSALFSIVNPVLLCDTCLSHRETYWWLQSQSAYKILVKFIISIVGIEWWAKYFKNGIIIIIINAISLYVAHLL